VFEATGVEPVGCGRDSVGTADVEPRQGLTMYYAVTLPHPHGRHIEGMQKTHGAYITPMLPSDTASRLVGLPDHTAAYSPAKLTRALLCDILPAVEVALSHCVQHQVPATTHIAVDQAGGNEGRGIHNDGSCEAGQL